jgi:predicted  nucleic acid-binding Zn-ribbon protein
MKKFQVVLYKKSNEANDDVLFTFEAERLTFQGSIVVPIMHEGCTVNGVSAISLGANQFVQEIPNHRRVTFCHTCGQKLQ